MSILPRFFTSDKNKIRDFKLLCLILLANIVVLFTTSISFASDLRASAISGGGKVVLRSDGRVVVYSEPTRLTAPKVILGIKDAIAIAGAQSGLALLRNGTVVGWQSRCSRAEEPVCVVSSKKIPMMQDIVSISAPDNIELHPAYLVATKDGAVFGWGDDENGQITGQTPPPKGQARIISQPRRVPLPVRMAKVFLGSLHAIGIDESGGVWTWGGWAHPDVRGSGDAFTGPNGFSAVHLTSIPAVRSASASVASYVVTLTGDVWTWGVNRIDGEYHGSEYPQQMHELSNIVDISTTGFTLYATDIKEYLYISGIDEVFSSPPTDFIEQVRKIPKLDNIDAISAASLSLATIQDGKLLAYGMPGSGLSNPKVLDIGH